MHPRITSLALCVLLVGSSALSTSVMAADPEASGRVAVEVPVSYAERAVVSQAGEGYGLEWLREYSGEAGQWGSDEATSIAIDSHGNILVAGKSYSTSLWFGYGLVKYSPSGEELWSRHFTLDPMHISYVRSMIVDEAGNSYLTGWGRTRIDGQAGPTETLTLKYSPEGELLWHHLFTSGDTHNTQPLAITFAADGHLLICGGAQNSVGGFRSMLLKLSKDGREMWSRELDLAPWTVFHSISVAPTGEISIGGTAGGNYTDLLVARYAADGNLLWYDWERSGFATYQVVHDITIDAAGNILALGRWGHPDLGPSFLLRKLSPEGEELWRRLLSHTEEWSADSPYRVIVDRHGDIVVAGVGGVGIGTNSVLVAKYSEDGDLRWASSYNANLLFAAATDMAIGGNGDIYTVGYAASSGGTQYFLVKFDRSGQVLWDARINGRADVWEHGNGIALDQHGNVHVTGLYWSDRYHSSFGTARFVSVTSQLFADGFED